MIGLSRQQRLIDDFLPFMLIIACVGCARFIKSELIVFSIFLATLAVYAWRRLIFPTTMITPNFIFKYVQQEN